MVLTHLSLFTGIGGLDLAAEWAGCVTVGQCEFADYPTKVLEKHWPDVPRWKDIRELTAESFYERTGLRTVDIISGGFPCQPFSVAGRRKGQQDDRYLWPEMLRVIQEIQPTWVIGENVPGIINMALDTVLSSLENEGYEVESLLIPACGVNAWHRRERICILAYSASKWDGIHGSPENALALGGDRTSDGARISWDDLWKRRFNQPSMGRMVSRLCERMDWPDTDPVSQQTEGCFESQIYRGGELQKEPGRTDRAFPGRNYWETEPDVDRVAHGVPNRVERIRCLGNAVVPQQFYPIFKAIVEIEKEMMEHDSTEIPQRQ